MISKLKGLIPEKVKAFYYKPEKEFRFATARFRTLPHFLVIGAQRAGTSSLFFYLTQHPDILDSFKKEIHFFDEELQKNNRVTRQLEGWYRAFFPLKIRMLGGKTTGEASPSYLYHPLVPARIHEFLPHVKMIILLRDPVMRALSHYFKEYGRGREPLEALEAFQAEEKRLETLIQAGEYDHPDYMYFSYKQRGIYHEQLERYFEHFPRKQFYITSSERFFSSPHSVLREIFLFLGVREDFQVPQLKAKNVGASKEEIDPDAYRYLREYFQPHNQLLYRLLGEEYGWQKPGDDLPFPPQRAADGINADRGGK